MNSSALSEVIEVISGGTPKTNVAEYWDNGTIGWLSVTDFNNDSRYVYSSEKKITESGLKNSNTKLLSKGDIIISARGTVGALAQIGTPMCFNQSCFGIRGKKNVVDTDFLFYYLRSYVSNIVKRSQGSVFDTINLASFDLMEIHYPLKISEQQKIASVLSALDAKIELNTKINAELEAMAKSLYDYWFVQFDFPADARTLSDAQSSPKRLSKGDGLAAKRGASSTSAPTAPYKSSGGKMVWSEDLKREVPEGWEVKNIAALTNTISRGISPKYLDNGGICVLNQKCIRENRVLYEFSRRHDNQLKSIGSKKVNLYDILVNSTGVGTLGRVAIVKRLPEEIVTTDSHVTIVRADKEKINQFYFGFSLIQKQKDIEGFSVGSTGQVELSRSQLEGIKLIVPPKEIQNSFGKIYLNALQRMSVCEEENQQLAELRDWLLPMLMNGQVKIV